MDKLLEKTYEEALHKALDALLIAASTVALQTGSAMLKSSPMQNSAGSATSFSTLGTTNKKRTQAYLETGEERTVVETYKLNPHGQWELTDVKIEDSPSA